MKDANLLAPLAASSEEFGGHNAGPPGSFVFESGL